MFMTVASIALKGHQRVALDPKLGEAGAAAKVRQVDDEGRAHDFRIQLTQQFDRSSRRAAGGDEVVDEQHRLAWLQRILMDLDNVDSVLEFVLLANGLRRKLALLADRHEAAAQAIGDSAAEDEAARLDAGNRLDPPVGKWRDQPLDAGAQSVGMTEQRGDVAEHDAGLRIVRYRTHEVLEIDVFGQAHARTSSWASSRGPASVPIVERSAAD